MHETFERCRRGDQLFVGNSSQGCVQIRLVSLACTADIAEIECVFPSSWQREPILPWIATTGKKLAIGPAVQEDEIIMIMGTFGSGDVNIGVRYPTDHELRHRREQLEKAS